MCLFVLKVKDFLKLFHIFICSSSINKGWLNPPLRFSNEPCRHKILDLVGDLSLAGRGGNQGLPIAHFFAYKVVEWSPFNT